MKIAVIGTGHMGRALGQIWAKNGHEVMFGSRDT
ncbi:MAG TPA: F420-dependent NADP oxidoreductase, partial [Anaerolineae bacterium]|nr:F420-dependent NADP oxidoreductase [Anaerolineae bacterium]